MAARLRAETKDEYSTPETGKRKTLKLAWERVDPEALKEVVRKTLHGMAAEERTLFYEKLILELEQGAIGVGAYLMILGITASTDAITPLEWGHLIRYFRVNVPHAMRAVSKVLGRFPAFAQGAQEYYRLHLVKGSPRRAEKLTSDVEESGSAFGPQPSLPARAFYRSHGSPVRIPGALFRAMATFFLQENPNRSREALARELHQKLLCGGIRYHLRTLKRQLTGRIASVPPEVEKAMCQLLLDGSGLKTVADIEEALAGAALRVPEHERFSRYIPVAAILPLARLWRHLNPSRSKRFLARRLQSELERAGIRLTVNQLQQILAGKRYRLARSELRERLLALLREHGIKSEAQAHELYESLAKEIRQSLEGWGLKSPQRFSQLSRLWKLYHREASSKPLAVRLQQKMLERGVVISLDQLGRLVNGRTGRVRSRITSAMVELLRQECAGMQNLDEEIARLTSKTGRETDLCWVQAKPIAILARTWISEHPGFTMRQLAVRVWQTIRRMGYRRSVNSVQPILGGWKKKTRGFVYRAMLSQFKRPDQTRIPKEHIIGPAWAIGLGPPEGSSTKC